MSYKHARQPFNSWDALKIIALLLMFIDHAGHFFYADDAVLRAIGRGAAPIFLFLAGYASSYRFSRELLGLAVALGLAELLITGEFHKFNILFTILACRLIFREHEKRYGNPVRLPVQWFIYGILAIPTLWLSDYGGLGFLFALSGHLQRHAALRYNVSLPASFLVYGFFTGTFSQPPINVPVMTVTLALTYVTLAGFRIVPLGQKWPLPLVTAGKLASAYSGYIYVAHLIALIALTGMPQ